MCTWQYADHIYNFSETRGIDNTLYEEIWSKRLIGWAVSNKMKLTVNNASEENKPCRDRVACPRPTSAKEKESWDSNSGLLTPTFSRDESILSLLCLGQGHLRCPILFHASRSTCVISIENSHWPLRGSKTCLSDEWLKVFKMAVLT